LIYKKFVTTVTSFYLHYHKQSSDVLSSFVTVRKRLEDVRGTVGGVGGVGGVEEISLGDTTGVGGFDGCITSDDVYDALGYLMARDVELLKGLVSVVKELSDVVDRGGRVMSEVYAVVSVECGGEEVGIMEGWCKIMAREVFIMQMALERIKDGAYLEELEILWEGGGRAREKMREVVEVFEK
jgi:hypothetical protein